MPSIKVLNLSLVLLCIFTTALVCTVLAVTSNEKALDDTKESRDVSVAAAFMVGRESATNRTEEYLDLLMEHTMEFLEVFTGGHRTASESVAKELMAAPWDSVKQFDWHRMARYYYAFDLQRGGGNTAVGFVLSNRLMIMNYEEYATLTNGPDEHHSYLVGLNYGDDHPIGGVNRTFTANTDKGNPIGVTDPHTDVNWADNATHPCVKRDIPSQGAFHDDPCVFPLIPDPVALDNYLISAMVPLGATLWTPPLPIAGYLALNSFTPISHNGVRTGYAASGADLRHVSKHFTHLKIGGSVGGYPSRGRVFVTLRSTWFDPTGTLVGRMLGASHGEVIAASGTEALLPTESSDPIISTVANRTEGMGLNLTEAAASGKLTVLNIETELAPQGEEFDYRVGRLQDDHGVDWYVHLVIDREYILGTIDRRTAETLDEIMKAERKVDDDLKEARTVLYVVIACVAIVLTVLSAVFVLQIIKPLLVLEKEMAAVAVMNLEAVNIYQTLSVLEEVRLMQVSFLQMIQNLVEYRNYMPASVLQTEDEDSEEETSANEASSAETSKVASGGSSHGAAGAAKGKTVLLHDTDVRVRRVTLMVCNVVGFLRVKESHHMQGLLTKYLVAGLQHLKATKGIPDSFSGDRLYASWNGARACSSHRTAAYMCARELSNDKVVTAKLSVGLASGEVKCGNMGCEGMKKYSYIGGLSSWVHVVERIGRSMECDVAIDSVVNEEVCNKVYTRMLQHVEFEKHSSRVLRVYEAMKRKEVAVEEWMYQLREGDSNDPNKRYTTSYELFMEGRVREAVKEIGEYNDGTKVVRQYRERLQGALVNPAACEPVGRSTSLWH